MFIKKYRLMDEANDDGGNGGGNEPTIEQLQAQLAEANKSVEGLKAKTDELLGEKKREANKRREAEETAAAAALEKAKADGDHEQLYKSSEQKRLELQTQLDNMTQKSANEKRNTAALKLATELADGYNAELLSEHIAKRLKYVNDELKVTDENGELTVSTMDDLKSIFKNNDRYASLLKGNQSNGGGAYGGKNDGGGAAKTLTRAEFEALNAADRMKFSKSGGTIE